MSLSATGCLAASVQQKRGTASVGAALAFQADFRERVFMSLMSCFTPEKAYQEGVIIGRLMIGYGELEVAMCKCLIAVEGVVDLSIRKLFQVRRASDRIEAVRKMLKPAYEKADLHAPLVETLDDMEWCRQVCNQYSHCQWYWTPHEHLCFVNLEDIAKQPKLILHLTSEKKSLSLKLLNQQEDFFDYVERCLGHLAQSYVDRDRKSSLSALKRPVLISARPPKRTRPPLA
jgi:hypothetical protein